MHRYLLATTLTFALVTPAFAANFYVTQDTATKKCTVVDKDPDGSPPESNATMMVSNQTYTSKADAEAAMAAMDECK